MNKIQYIIFNGPPGCGKTTMSRELAINLTQRGFTNVLDSFATPFKQFFATALGDKWATMDKIRPRPELAGYTLREAWIDMAENYVKERYGKDCFGRWLVHRSLRFPEKKAQFYIIDDGGFVEEIEAVPNRFIVRVTRPGKTFIGDSRSYFPVSNYVLNNDKGLPEMWAQINELTALLTGN